jgi:hypothetical protein
MARLAARKHAVATRLLNLAVAVGTWLLLTAIPLTASANGRYPMAQQLLVDPSNADRLWLRATYGIMTSRDRGRSWDWICESAVGYGSQEDPMLAVTMDGTVFAATRAGLRVTRDGGCSWTANGDIVGTVVDLAVEHDRRHVLALVLVPGADNYDIVVYRSDAQSQRFFALGPAVSSDLLGWTLDPAPSDPKRIYVTGSSFPVVSRTEAGAPSDDASSPSPDGLAFLLRTFDGGATWQRLPIPAASFRNSPFIAAVHPTNPDVIYLRVQGEPRTSGTIESFLLYTDNAGETWKEIFRGPADTLGFALSANGSLVFVGLGDSRDPTGDRRVDPKALGIYRASPPAFAFTKMMSGQVSCLTKTGQDLFLCGDHASEGFELGVLADDGQGVSSLLDFGSIRGPLACPENTMTSVKCEPEWLNQCSLLGQCEKEPPPDIAPTRSSSTPEDTGGRGCILAHGEPPEPAAAAVVIAVWALLCRKRARKALRA